MKLGVILLETGLINNNQLSEALADQAKSGKRLGATLIEKGYVNSRSMYEVLEFQLGIPYANLSLYSVSSQVARLIPENMAKKYEIIPIKLEGNVITIAAADPLNSIAFDDVRIYTGYEVLPVMGDPDKILSLISTHFSSRRAIEAVEEFNKANNSFIKAQSSALSDMDSVLDVSDSPAVKLINILIEQATQRGASDIHIEPQNKVVKIRFRIDGELQDIMQPDIEILPSVVSRIKVMSDLNIAEKRLPQDGRAAYRVGNKDIDLRISVLPTIYGEKVVIRVISKLTFDIPKEKMGFLPENLKNFERILKNPNGIILVTGPTGSGKTTTLYTALKELNKPNVNIITVEDPVEGIIEGINQVPVNPKAGLTFANTLRSMLRQDPDIILVGEIRDSETAEIAVRAAITGHLVLSTLHTSDAASSIYRLIDMGIQPFLVSTSVVGIVAQRLVRRICSNCRASYLPTEMEIEQFDWKTGEKLVFYKGKGCGVCNSTGYKGRTAVHEILRVGSELRNAIYRGDNADQLKEIAIQTGMISLRENCKRLVLQGITTFDELIKIAYIQE